ncbi:hypothetical protein HID58_066559, partial [Brassica napus]
FGGVNSANISFQKIFDRHGNSFGERVSTKQTLSKRTQTYASHLYSKKREGISRPSQRGIYLFPQWSSGQWRPKQVSETEDIPVKPSIQKNPAIEETNQMDPLRERTSVPQVLSKEAVMEKLHEVTRQYPSFPDPQFGGREFYGDANILMEETTTSIMGAAAKQPTLPLQLRASDSKPITPPPINEYPLHAWLFLVPLVIYSPLARREEDYGLESKFSDDPPYNKARRRIRIPAKLRSPRFSPNILRGISSKKKKIS